MQPGLLNWIQYSTWTSRAVQINNIFKNISKLGELDWLEQFTHRKDTRIKGARWLLHERISSVKYRSIKVYGSTRQSNPTNKMANTAKKNKTSQEDNG